MCNRDDQLLRRRAAKLESKVRKNNIITDDDDDDGYFGCIRLLCKPVSLPCYIENDSFAPLCISQLGLSPLLLAGMHCIEHMVFTGSCAALYKKHSKRNNSRTTSTSSQFNDRSPVLSVEWTDGDSPRYT